MNFWGLPRMTLKILSPEFMPHLSVGEFFQFFQIRQTEFLKPKRNNK
jgi:hypothetical protein